MKKISLFLLSLISLLFSTPLVFAEEEAALTEEEQSVYNTMYGLFVIVGGAIFIIIFVQVYKRVKEKNKEKLAYQEELKKTKENQKKKEDK